MCVFKYTSCFSGAMQRIIVLDRGRKGSQKANHKLKFNSRVKQDNTPFYSAFTSVHDLFYTSRQRAADARPSRAGP